MRIEIYNSSKTFRQKVEMRTWTRAVVKALREKGLLHPPAKQSGKPTRPKQQPTAPKQQPQAEPTSLQIAIVDQTEMQNLNFKFRRKKKPTDVLSFAAAEPDSLGELAICWPVICEQARAHGHTQQEEMGYMILHGILHLLGFDHEKSDKEARAMYRLQDTLFEQLRTEILGGHRNRTQRRQKSSS